jgi:predicted RNA-binding protein with PIN domain
MGAEAVLYLFDGYNLLHAGPGSDPRALADTLASWVAAQGARGVLVFDGGGDDAELGPLSVRYAGDADALLERLAAEHRARERVVLVSSDAAVAGTAGIEVTRVASQTFWRELEPPRGPQPPPGDLAARLDEKTRAQLERRRRGQ